MKKYVALLMAAVMLFCFSGCGDGGSAPQTDPNAGAYTAFRAEMMGMELDVSSAFGQGFIIELRDNGKCKISVDGKTSNGSWTLTGTAINVNGGGVNCAGTLEDGILTLSNVMDMGITLTLVREGTSIPTKPSEDAASIFDLDSNFDFNVSSEAGYYTIFTFEDSEDFYTYEDLVDLELDYMDIALYDDGTGLINWGGSDLDEEAYFTWYGGEIDLDGEIFTYSCTDSDTIVLCGEDGSILTFTR